MKPKQFIVFMLVLVIGIGASLRVLKNARPAADPHAGPDQEEEAEAIPRGAHGGRLLSDGQFELEVVIFEAGVPPQFRVYAYSDKQPLDLTTVKVDIDLKRLGGRVDRHQFRKEGDYLVSDLVVYEPHSFDAQVLATHGGTTHRWEFESPEARVSITSGAAKSAGIKVEAAGPARIISEIDLPGEVRLNPERTASVVGRFEGVVTEVRKGIGDKVQAGEVLAVIESRALAEARSEYIEAVHRLELTQAHFIREENLWKKKISAGQDYLQAKHELEEAEIRKQAARQKLLSLGLAASELNELAVEPDGKVVTFQVRQPFPDRSFTRYEIRAGLAGSVIARSVALGQTVRSDEELFRIADLSTVWVEVPLYQQHLAAVQPGTRVIVVADAIGAKAEGVVSYISPILTEATRTAPARIVIPNPDGVWRPGLTVRARLVTGEADVPVAIKAAALQAFRDWQVVFLNEGDLYEPAVVEIGRRDGEWIEITSGLKTGQQYVAEGSFVIKADILKSGASHDH